MNCTGNAVSLGGGFSHSGLSVWCIKNDSIVKPSVYTASVSPTSTTFASSGGSVTNDGGSTITARGICWSAATAPTPALNTKTVDGIGTGNFTSSMTGLTPNTIYYLRAYATNAVGTSYGAEVNFSSNPISDIDGNEYHTVTIGTQTWLVENLKTTHYRNAKQYPILLVIQLGLC